MRETRHLQRTWQQHLLWLMPFMLALTNQISRSPFRFLGDAYKQPVAMKNRDVSR